MHDTQILSTFQDLPPVQPADARASALVFDACQLGVVLRAVLFVALGVAVAAMFVATTPWDWVLRLSLITGGALPATLAWLLSACVAKRFRIGASSLLHDIETVLSDAQPSPEPSAKPRPDSY